VNAPSDLTLFFGRFHPVLVHLPIGLILLMAFLEAISRWPKFRHATANAGLILAVGAPLSVVAAILGLLLSREGGYDPKLLQIHQWTGIATAAGFVLAALLYYLNLLKAYRFLIFASVVVLFIASHFGGSLTHGSDYLVRHAPGPVRGLLAKKQPAAPVSPSKNVAWDEQAAFAAVIHPILEDKCASCHGPEKSKGGLRVDSLEALLKGGDSGPAIVSGKSADSEVIKRMLLPLDHDDHMPPDGKPQPDRDELTLIRWWIDSGAKPEATIAALNPSAGIRNLLAKRLGAQSAGSSSPVEPAKIAAKPVPEMTNLVNRISGELEVPITFLGQDAPWIHCNASVAGKRFGDAELAKLADLGPNLRWLDLAGTAVTDAGLTNLAPFPNLARLHLERTAVTDAGLSALLPLRNLEYLNLHSTGVTDEGVALLGKAPRLRQLYVWQTKVTPAGAKAFTSARVDEEQIRQWEEQIEKLRQQIREQQVTVNLGTTNAPKVAASSSTNTTLNANCPVSGKPVDPTKTSTYEGKTIAFCCDNCKARFDADPKPFLAQLSAAK